MAVEFTAAPAPAVEFDGATREFGGRRGRVRALDDVSFAIAEGSITGVIGPSGAGKSTLIRTINGLEALTSGQVRVAGTSVGSLGERELGRLRAGIGMIFQRFNLMNSRTVAGNVEYPLTLARMPRSQRNRRVAELLDFVGIGDKAGAYPSQLSGGQSQRVGIARALARDPRILLADEATSALDPTTTSDVLALLRRINRELGTTIVVITHEMDVVRRVCDYVAVLDRGRLVDFGDVFEVFANPTSETARELVNAAIGDRPNAETLARLAEAHPGAIVGVDVRDTGNGAPDPAEVFTRHGLSARLLYGGISEIRDRPFGSLTFAVTGDDVGVESALAELGSAAHRYRTEKTS